MKKILSIFLSIVFIISFFNINTIAISDDNFVPYVVEFNILELNNVPLQEENSTRATGLITSYGLNLYKTGTTLEITGRTHGMYEVVKCGFKDLTIQRRKTSSDSWEDYYEYGNVYANAVAANLDTTLVVESGYQYRISCKHYAKKNLLSVQTIANTSNIVTVS